MLVRFVIVLVARVIGVVRSVIVLVGEITARPVVVDGRVVPREILPITATIDHRFVDGWHVSLAMKAFREYLAAPERYEPRASIGREATESARRL